MSMLPEGRERRVIVLGGHITALGIVRALAPFARHIEVWDRTDKSVAARSRHCSGFRQLDIHDRQIVSEALSTLPGFDGPGYVFPSEDLTAALVSQNLDELASLGFAGVAAPWSVMETFFYKEKTYALAAKAGVPTPRTVDLDADTHGINELLYPVILKPDVMQHFHELHFTKAIPCNDRTALEANFQRYRSEDGRYRLLAQEVIPGPARQNYSMGGLWQAGSTVSAICARRKRQYPIDFGAATTYLDSHCPEEIIPLSEKLMAASAYNGLAEVEYKLDKRDNQLKLLEVNPRLFKWHAYGMMHGLNLPAAQIALLEDHLCKTKTYIINRDKAWRDLFSDLAACVSEVRAGQADFKLLGQELMQRKMDSVFQVSDPWPFVRLLSLLPQLARGGRSAL